MRDKTNLISESVSNVTADVLYIFVDSETTGINHEKTKFCKLLPPVISHLNLALTSTYYPVAQ